MKQYWDIKTQHPDKVVLFRMGDFYEIFYEDATIAAPILNIALTTRNKKESDAPAMCGFPHHSLANYVNRLLENGHKVAICDQVEDPKLAKGLVKRQVTKILTPGMVFDFDQLESSSVRYIVSFDSHYIYFFEASTFENFKIVRDLSSSVDSLKDIVRITSNFDVVELIVFELNEQIKNLFVNYSVGEFGTKDDAGDLRLIAYLKSLNPEWKETYLCVFNERSLYQCLRMNDRVVKQLELFESYQGDNQYTLYSVLNKCTTSVGMRKLKQWIRWPLMDRLNIDRRLDQIEWLQSDLSFLKRFRDVLRSVYDIPRKLAKISQDQAHVFDVKNLISSFGATIEAVDMLQRKTHNLDHWILNDNLSQIHALKEYFEQLVDIFVENPPALIKSGGIFRKGYHAELDKWIEISENASKLVADLECREKNATQITSLKVRYNQVFGYYIEVTNTHLDKVPAHYKRKQTLANAERFYTDELLSLEKDVLQAQTRRGQLEFELFCQIKNHILSLSPQLLMLSDYISVWDSLSSLAWVAIENGYVRPKFSENSDINITLGRHPVVEKFQKSRFVPNSITIKNGELWILTGPNMAGKSTLMRQIGLIQIMGQLGSFVPADQAELPILDGVYTRIGASDFLSEGLSTFMVEMKETSEILEEITPKSLVLIDELGRGTSTYDGMSLAQSVAEYLVQEKPCYCLFATHYHELTNLDQESSKFKNAHLQIIQKELDQFQFTYQLISGAAGKSYGIQVAKLASLPDSIISRAHLIHTHLEGAAKGQSEENVREIKEKKDNNEKLTSNGQIELINEKLLAHEDIRKVLKFDINQLTPLEGLVKLSQVQRKLLDLVN